MTIALIAFIFSRFFPQKDWEDITIVDLPNPPVRETFFEGTASGWAAVQIEVAS